MGGDTNEGSGKKFNWMRFFNWGCLVLVVLILVAIALPDFIRGYGSRKAKQSEAKMNLGAIFTCQVAYYTESGEYGSTFEQINWAPEGKHIYAYYCKESIIKNVKGRPIDLDPKKIWPYKVRPDTSKTAFTCMAIGNTDKDDTLDVWTIDDTKNLRNIVNDVVEN